jgi:hypothetical protein
VNYQCPHLDRSVNKNNAYLGPKLLQGGTEPEVSFPVSLRYNMNTRIHICTLTHAHIQVKMQSQQMIATGILTSVMFSLAVHGKVTKNDLPSSL